MIFKVNSTSELGCSQVASKSPVDDQVDGVWGDRIVEQCIKTVVVEGLDLVNVNGWVVVFGLFITHAQSSIPEQIDQRFFSLGCRGGRQYEMWNSSS